jgi:hypothetical protein
VNASGGTRDKITIGHLRVTLERVEIMVAAVRSALASMMEAVDQRNRPVEYRGEAAVILAGLTKTGCRRDGSCARLRWPVASAASKRPSRKAAK